jgi:cell division protein FtsB
VVYREPAAAPALQGAVDDVNRQSAALATGIGTLQGAASALAQSRVKLDRDNQTLKTEIDRLRSENATLKAQTGKAPSGGGKSE